MFKFLRHAIFVGDPTWAWRRRLLFTGCAMALAGVATAQWFTPDTAWAAVLLAQSWAAFGATAAIYAGLATYDDNQKRKAGESPSQS
jgi:hypothetical protein